MSHALIVFPEAEEEAFEAAAWYDERQEGLGLEWLAELDRTFERIQHNPRQFPCWQRDPAYRTAVVARFPYVVFFVERAETVEVVAVAHGRRRPGYWRPRLRPL